MQQHELVSSALLWHREECEFSVYRHTHIDNTARVDSRFVGSGSATNFATAEVKHYRFCCITQVPLGYSERESGLQEKREEVWIQTGQCRRHLD